MYFFLEWSDRCNHVWCNPLDESPDDDDDYSSWLYVNMFACCTRVESFLWKSHIPLAVLEAVALRLRTRHIDSALEYSHPGSLPNHHALYLTDYSTSSWSLWVNQITSANGLLSSHSSSLLIGTHFVTASSILRGFCSELRVTGATCRTTPGSAVRFHTGPLHLSKQLLPGFKDKATVMNNSFIYDKMQFSSLSRTS